MKVEKSMFQIEIGALEVVVIASHSDVNALTALLTRQATVRELCPREESDTFRAGDPVMYRLADGTLVAGTYYSNFRSENAEVKREGLYGHDVVPEHSLLVSLESWLADDNELKDQQPVYYVDDDGSCGEAKYMHVLGEAVVIHMYLDDGPRIIKVPSHRVYVRR